MHEARIRKVNLMNDRQCKRGPTDVMACVGTVIETGGVAVKISRTVDTAVSEATPDPDRTRTLMERGKEELLAILSHELRTPLQSVLGWVQIMQRDIPPSSKQTALRAIESNARAMSRIIDDLAEESRIVFGKLCLRTATVDIGDIVREAATAILPLAERRDITLRCRIASSPMVLEGDRLRLLQAISNLLSNAMKFTGAGGHVDIEAEAIDTNVRVRVSDTGRGIDPALLPRLFERFQQGDDKGVEQQGLGLGLALVKEFVERHGGEVHADSAGEERGATFTVTLPARSHFPIVDASTYDTEESTKAGQVQNW